jgi:hypothetical protein
MIATGLSWRMAIGALVLGNAIMGMVITINGRIGARVSEDAIEQKRRSVTLRQRSELYASLKLGRAMI